MALKNKKVKLNKDDDLTSDEIDPKQQKKQEKKQQRDKKRAEQREQRKNKVTERKGNLYGFFKRLRRSKNNVIVSVDTFNNSIRVMQMKRSDVKSAKITEYPYNDREALIGNDFFSFLTSVLKGENFDSKSNQSASVYLVLPDNLITTDIIRVPTMRQSNVIEATKTEIEINYKNAKDLNIKFHVIAKDKLFSSVSVMLVRKEVIRDFYVAMNNAKVYPSLITYAANSAVDCVFALSPKYRGKSFIFMDVKEKYTRIAIVNKGHTHSYATLGVGYSVLDDDKINYEDTLYNHDVAELAVLNAIEAAKAKMLTVSEDAANIPLEGGAADVPESFLDSVASQQNAGVEAMGAPTDNGAEAGSQAPAGNSKVFVKSVPKKRPKFLVQETPESPEQFMYLNFKIFVKWALLYYDSVNDKGVLSKPSFVLFNLPERYSGLIDLANKDENKNPVPFRYFKQSYDQSDLCGNNMELFGAIHAFHYNKHNNI